MQIELDRLMKMKPQAICSNKDLVKEFAKVRKKLLNKGFNKLTFEDTKDRNSRLWFQNRRLVSYNAIKDEAIVRFDKGGLLKVSSKFLNINRLIVIKSIAEYILKIRR